MREITPEIKAKIFALYYGQNVYNRYGWPGLIVNGVVDFKGQFHVFDSTDTRCFLELKPISAITDEEAIACYHLHYAAIGYDYTNDFKDVTIMTKHWLENGGFKDMIKCAMTVDYLRSKGYAIGYLYHSVDELIAAGVFKLKQ